MPDAPSIPYQTLYTFGRLNVHLTHELQNVMATISETSGLLEDLAAFRASGGQVDDERLARLLGRVVTEAQRGQQLVGRINSLAHSTDEPSIELDLARVVRFMAEVSTCFPKARRITLDLCEEPVTLEAAPYYVEQLLYGAITAAFAGLDPDSDVGLAMRREAGACLLRFTGLAADAGGDAGPFPDEATALAARALSAELELDRTAGNLGIRVPLTR